MFKHTTLFAAVAGLVLALAGTANAADLYWSGTGTWGVDSLWATSSGGTYDQPWTADANAVFEGTAGTVAVSGSINVTDLTFNSSGNYLISGGTLNFATGASIGNPVKNKTPTITSVITGSPIVNCGFNDEKIYLPPYNSALYKGLIFAPTSGTVALGTANVPFVGCGGDKGGLWLGGTTTGNSVSQVACPGGNYGALYKYGTGTWTVGNVNVGIVGVAAGTLIVNGTVTTNYLGLVMSGSGVLSGNANIYKSDRRATNDFVSGSGIAPGTSVGTITFDWGTSATPTATQWTTYFRAGSTYEWEVGAGNTTDTVHIVDGRLRIEGFTLKILDAGGVPLITDQLPVFTYGTLNSKTLSLGSVVFDTTGAPGWDASGASLVDNNSGTIYLTGLVPEPATMALLALGGLGLILGRKRR